MFGKKRIEELERRLSDAERELEVYRKDEEERKKKLHNPGVWCSGCPYAMIESGINYMGHEYTRYHCMLDHECKDRVISDSEGNVK